MNTQPSMCSVLIYADSRYPVDRRLLRLSISSLVEKYGLLDRRVLVEVSLVGNRKMKQLNQTYLHFDETTDVLAFPLESDRPSPDGLLRLGDVVICYPQAKVIALAWNRIIDRVIAELAEHGVKHLLGEHHE